ncbi:MAG: tetratricopeptide repeat protein [Burkholderiales bacterium]|nr:tetratricopeptide repeat protein [Burkholderiales bacterium]
MSSPGAISRRTERRPGLAAALWRRAAAWSERRGLEGATRAFLRFAGEAGDSRAALDLAKRLLDRDENREAAQLLERFVERDPANARGWMMLGARAPQARSDRGSDRGDPPRAFGRPALRRGAKQPRRDSAPARAVRPRRSPSSTGRSRTLPTSSLRSTTASPALYELGRFEEAERSARGGDRKAPGTCRNCTSTSATCFCTPRRARQAVRAYRRALEIDPACAEAAFSLAMLYGETPSLGAFRDYLEKEIALKGETAQRLAALALARHAAGDISGAEESARRVLELQPANVAALMTLAGCLSARGEHVEAVRVHERTLELWPQLHAAASNICFEATYIGEYTG